MKKIWPYLLTLQHRKRRRVIIAIDIVCIAIAAVLTHLISGSYPGLTSVEIAISAVLLIVASAVTFNVLRVHRAIIRHLDVSALTKLLLAIILAAMIWLVALLAYLGAPTTFNEFIITSIMMMISLLIGYRLFLYWLLGVNHTTASDLKPVGIYGTGRKSLQAVDALKRSRTYQPVFYITEDNSLAGGMMNGVRIYQAEQLDWALSRFKPEAAIFSCSNEEFRSYRNIVYKLLDRNITVRVNTSLEDQINTGPTVLSSRAVELQDLIGRHRRPVIDEMMDASIAGMNILVTGAGGSIGSELCRRICDREPASIAILDSDEIRLVATSRALQNSGQLHKTLLGNICDRGFVRNVFTRNRFDIVFHAAAYKHVDFGENMAISMIRNNVLGTRILMEACDHGKVGKLVFISSDKAVEPANVMGATKKWCEEMIRSQAQKEGNTKYCIVRFGNVIESSGSVVPIFKQQIEKGGPVTITDRRMTRYFMSIEEAVDLILQASSFSENGETYILKMGKPVAIMRIAETLIRLSGNTIRSLENPEGDIEILETGIRKGEKLNEKLYSEMEQVMESEHPSILKSNTWPINKQQIEASTARLVGLVEAGNPAAVRSGIFELLAEMEQWRRTDGCYGEDNVRSPAKTR